MRLKRGLSRQVIRLINQSSSAGSFISQVSRRGRIGTEVVACINRLIATIKENNKARVLTVVEANE